MNRAARLSLGAYERLSPKAKARQSYLVAVERDSHLTMAERRARSEAGGEWVPPAECMTGDGNVPVRGALCRWCVDRRYGEVGELHNNPEICAVCYTPHVVWMGNVWSARILCDFLGIGSGPGGCQCPCHETDVWIA